MSATSIGADTGVVGHMSSQGVMAKCKAYQEERAKAKAKRLRGTLRAAVALFILGLGLRALGLGAFDERDKVGIVVHLVSDTLIQIAFCTQTSCPTSEVNLNSMLKRRFVLRIGLGITFAAVALAWGGLFGIPSAVFGLLIALNRRSPDVSATRSRRATPFQTSGMFMLRFMPREMPCSSLGGFLQRPYSTTLLIGFLSCRVFWFLEKLTTNPSKDAVFLVSFPLLMINWLYQRHRYLRTGGEQGADPTLRFYYYLYGNFANSSVYYFIRGLSGDGAHHFVNSFVNAISPLVLLTIGRDRLFNFWGRRFEVAQARSDGAMMAELLAHKESMMVGATRWVHRSAPDETFEPLDPRRNWQKGTIVKVTATYISVESPDGQVEQFAHVSDHVEKTELLEIARRDLRGIPWSNFSPELMKSQSSAGNDSPTELSVPISFTDGPDFFCSHSWHDNPQTKYAELAKIAQEFRGRRGREPVFWLDKVCINQQNISEGLKVLPINVMASKLILVLCGETYLSRLWCVIELCTLLSFMDEAEAAKRVVFRALPGSSMSEQEFFDYFMDFDVSQAPNLLLAEGSLRDMESPGKPSSSKRYRAGASSRSCTRTPPL